MSLSRDELESFDPGRWNPDRHEVSYRCPTEACREHNTRKLYVNTRMGLYFCQRCGEKGKLVEFQETRQEREHRRRRERSRRVWGAIKLSPIDQIRAKYPPPAKCSNGELHWLLNDLHQLQVEREQAGEPLPRLREVEKAIANITKEAMMAEGIRP